jgi:hypothetical protein
MRLLCTEDPTTQALHVTDSTEFEGNDPVGFAVNKSISASFRCAPES